MTGDEKRFFGCLEAKQRSGELQWHRLPGPSVSHMIFERLGVDADNYRVVFEKILGLFADPEIRLEVFDKSNKPVFVLEDFPPFFPWPSRLLRFFKTVRESVVRQERTEQDRSIAEATHRICGAL